jgi:ribA/ribD-fused uncharacterized protein
MADFCKECYEEHFGPEGTNDLAGLCKEGEIASVICEGCGPIFVNHEGICHGNHNYVCLRGHEKNRPDDPVIRAFDDTEYRWLSNFHPCEIEYLGLTYPTSENAYQAMKANALADREQFVDCGPGKAKRLGQKVTKRFDWETVKLRIMKDILRIKFQNSDLREKLLATKGKHIVEGNTWNDTFWGVCNGVGDNHLGRILMEIRDELSTSEVHPEPSS